MNTRDDDPIPRVGPVGVLPDGTNDPDPFDAIEVQMKAWADPIADQLMAELRDRKLPLPMSESEADLREMASTLISGLAAMNLCESLKMMLPRDQQEAGRGTIRFKRDATGELCVTVDDGTSPFGRMSVREMYVTELRNHAFPEPLPELASTLAETAILEGRAFLMSFVHAPSASTPDEAIYVWRPSEEELKEVRDAWYDNDVAGMEQQVVCELRAERLLARLADVGMGLPPFIKDGLSGIDLALALDLLGAFLETCLNDERCPGAVILRPDDSILVDPESGFAVPGEAVLARLAGDFADAKPVGTAIPAVDLLAWCRAQGGPVGTDLFQSLKADLTSEGLRVTRAETGQTEGKKRLGPS